MKSILMSIKPKWIEKITSGEKTVEVRKTVPKCGTPFKVYMYETRDGGHSCKRCDETAETCYSWAKSGVGCYNGRGKVVGEFVCDKIYLFVQAGAGIMFADDELNQLDPQDARDMTCLTDEEIYDYLNNKDGYGLHISDLKIYDKPKELNEFRRHDKNLDFAILGDIDRTCPLTRPPQSWCYVEELWE